MGGGFFGGRERMAQSRLDIRLSLVLVVQDDDVDDDDLEQRPPFRGFGGRRTG